MWKKLSFIAAFMTGIGTIITAFADLKTDPDTKKKAQEDSNPEETPDEEDSNDEES